MEFQLVSLLLLLFQSSYASVSSSKRTSIEMSTHLNNGSLPSDRSNLIILPSRTLIDSASTQRSILREANDTGHQTLSAIKSGQSEIKPVTSSYMNDELHQYSTDNIETIKSSATKYGSYFSSPLQEKSVSASETQQTMVTKVPKSDISLFSPRHYPTPIISTNVLMTSFKSENNHPSIMDDLSSLYSSAAVDDNQYLTTSLYDGNPSHNENLFTPYSSFGATTENFLASSEVITLASSSYYIEKGSMSSNSASSSSSISSDINNEYPSSSTYSTVDTVMHAHTVTDKDMDTHYTPAQVVPTDSHIESSVTRILSSHSLAVSNSAMLWSSSANVNSKEISPSFSYKSVDHALTETIRPTPISSSSFHPSSSSIYVPAFDQEQKMLNQKVTDLEDQVSTLKISISVVSAFLGFVLIVIIVFMVIRSKGKSSSRYLDDEHVGNGLRRDADKNRHHFQPSSALSWMSEGLRRVSRAASGYGRQSTTSTQIRTRNMYNDNEDGNTDAPNGEHQLKTFGKGEVTEVTSVSVIDVSHRDPAVIQP